LSRSNTAEYCRRVNQAIQFLEQEKTSAEVVACLTVRLGVSARQAARYVQAAQQQSAPLPVPEANEVFTVKLPPGLIDQVRQRARTENRSISQWVTQALEAHLQRQVRHG